MTPDRYGFKRFNHTELTYHRPSAVDGKDAVTLGGCYVLGDITIKVIESSNIPIKASS